MRRTAMKPSTVALKRTGFLRTQFKEQGAAAKVKRAMRSGRPQATAAEREHLAAVARMGCCLCIHLDFGPTPAEVHHVRARHGWGRSGHFATIPLCPTHHRGQPGGVHDMGRGEFTKYYGVSELELLERVTLAIAGQKLAGTGLAPITNN